MFAAPIIPIFAESMHQLLQEAYTDDNDKSYVTYGQLRTILEILPECVPPIFDYLFATFEASTVGLEKRIKILSIIRMLVEVLPNLAPKVLDKLSSISHERSPEKMDNAVQKTLNIAKRAMPSAVSWSAGRKGRKTYVHCPLCYCPILYPEKDGRKPALIFLDMDGVMMPHSRPYEQIAATLQEMFPHVPKDSYTNFQRLLVLPRYLDKDALSNLHHIIDQIEASGQRPLVVISSAWRPPVLVDQQRTEGYALHKFGKYLCGKTPTENSWEADNYLEFKLGFNFYENALVHYNLELKSRGDAIEFWLRDHHFDPATTNFVVLDDEHVDSLSRFGKRFIETEDILESKHAQAAVDVLCGKKADGDS